MYYGNSKVYTVTNSTDVFGRCSYRQAEWNRWTGVSLDYY